MKTHKKETHIVARAMRPRHRLTPVEKIVKQYCKIYKELHNLEISLSNPLQYMATLATQLKEVEAKLFEAYKERINENV